MFQCLSDPSLEVLNDALYRNPFSSGFALLFYKLFLFFREAFWKLCGMFARLYSGMRTPMWSLILNYCIHQLFKSFRLFKGHLSLNIRHRQCCIFCKFWNLFTRINIAVIALYTISLFFCIAAADVRALHCVLWCDANIRLGHAVDSLYSPFRVVGLPV